MQGLVIFNTLVGIGTIILLGITLSIIILRFLAETKNRWFLFWQKNSLWFAFIVATSATLGSLAYEFIFGLPPCTFCWWQRIFMYPQVVILGVAIAMRDTKIWLSSILLSTIGGIFSISHIMLQSGIRSAGLSCELNGVSCTSIDILIFNWITIPIMCLIAFVTILTCAYLHHTKNPA